jgi:hypothetical protein
MAEPHIGDLGRDPPDYDFLARVMMLRILRECNVLDTASAYAQDVLEGDIRHELREAFKAGQRSAKGDS